ncbi:acyl-CoA dehydrogenase family protein [Mycolicibacterium fluoranthenivorans]|uniref:Alkylation response protein AidB-like acyl-CoA dehydrogenase n=1 Tax=Mycolicibacterium fluoranthenivorans TaxID=258505 RepID=A0A7X5TZY8_9MYCO|nr:acyl-CoA dehydrogenase family protein [Mycolicibacterium fluoranthenivorans]MCV7358040.1 acyl-CoA/acyl-ACP dehydrogenase [Mycolicibacterium fluoranthenivorans]NIH95842.1 alkylation response protein AidB-like acyl-CoA dehydrogenase [Mycolicibacterium fluoranthenivorans]
MTNPEQLLFASTARAFLDKEASLGTVRDLHARAVSFEPGWWRRAAELGWTSLLVPEELGGGSVSGAGVADLALVAEQAGHTVAPGPLHPVSVVLSGLVEAPDGHTDLIEALVSGETVASWAVYEPGRPFEPASARTTASRTGSGYRIDGVKDRVEAGTQADAFLVVAESDGAPRQFLVPADAPGVSVTAQKSVDLVKTYARVQFDGVDIEASAALGSAEQTGAVIERQRQVALILQCAEIVGILDAVLAMTHQWLLDRHSFGRPLASYQALKHRFADMKLWFEACRATTAGAVEAVGTRSPEAPMLVSVAKAYVAERAPMMLQDCVQLHGGIGVTWEHDLHLYLRRAALNRAMYGSPEDHHRAVFELSRTQPEEAFA